MHPEKWKWEECDGNSIEIFMGDVSVAFIVADDDKLEQKHRARAQFIVKACNALEENI